MDKDRDSQDPSAPPEVAGTEGNRDSGEGSPVGFRGPLGEHAVERLRRYQVITLPPDARAAMLGVKLPGASPELLYDTLPPRGGAEPARESGDLSTPPHSMAQDEVGECEHGDVEQGQVEHGEVEQGESEAPLEVPKAPAPLSTRKRVVLGFLVGFAATLLGLAAAWFLVSQTLPSPSPMIQRESTSQSGLESQLPTAEPSAAPATEQAVSALAAEPPSPPPPEPKPSELRHRTAPNLAPKNAPPYTSPPAAAGTSLPAISTARAAAPTGSAAKNMRMGAR